jgi:2'-5' RNA ligase superfamily
MNLHVVAYPELAASDFEMIQAFRKDYNSLYNVIGPHFTIVFSVPDMPYGDFATEVTKQAQRVAEIRFCFRCAVVNKDSFSNNYDAFLVPDEGFSQIVRLHDKLYSDKLAHHHRLDISYIPHLSIANSPDATAIKKIVDHWNEQGNCIEGIISALDIVNYENRVITTMERVGLGM